MGLINLEGIKGVGEIFTGIGSLAKDIRTAITGIDPQKQAEIELKLVEMEKHHDHGFCCGAGGGRMWMEEHHGERINNTRTDMALKVNATAIATACPFCNTMVMDGLKARNVEEKVAAKDIAEIVWEAMGAQEAPKEEPKAQG